MVKYKGYDIEVYGGCGSWDYCVYKDGSRVADSEGSTAFFFAWRALGAAKKRIKELTKDG